MFIDDYFTDLINELDIKAEKLLAKIDLTQEQIKKINKKREEFIKEIQNVKSFNLEALEFKSFDQEELNFNLERLLSKFCFTITDPKTDLAELDFIDIYFGYLIICDEYVSKEVLENFKKIIRKESRRESVFLMKSVRFKIYEF